MKSTTESGHAVNAGNFSNLIKCCEEQGSNYAPPDPAISLTSLKQKETKIYDALKTLNLKAAPWMQAVNERAAAMAPVGKMMTRVKNMVYASAAKPQFKADIKSMVNKMLGVRISAKMPVETGNAEGLTGNEVKQISAAQTGVDHTIDTMEKLIELLKVEPNYTPTENELAITTLEAGLADLKVKNAAVIAATPAVDNARLSRDKEMYLDAGSGNELSSKVKAYFKARFGGNSREYHNVAKYEFKKLVKS